MEFSHQQMELIKTTAQLTVERAKVEWQREMNQAFEHHQRVCPKFELGIGKIITAALGSGGVVAILTKVLVR